MTHTTNAMARLRALKEERASARVSEGLATPIPAVREGAATLPEPPTAANEPEGPPSAAEIKAVQATADTSAAAATQAAVAAASAGLEVFMDTNGNARMAVKRSTGRVDVLHLDEEAATDHVRHIVSAAMHGKPVPPQRVEQILSLHRAEARDRRDVRRVRVRVAADNGDILLDLANDAGQVVRISQGTAAIEQQGHVLFERGAGVGELPLPDLTLSPREAELTLGDVLGSGGVPVGDVPVMITWLCESMRPDTPKPGLEILGGAGAGKTSAARTFISITDPTTGCGDPPNTKPTPEDVMAAVHQRRVLYIDNASKLTVAEQDLLCQVSTGGQLSMRKLYSQREQALGTVLNPMAITAITPVVTRSDLRSRFISITLTPRAGYVSEAILRQRFTAEHPRMLGAVITLLAAGLAGLAKVRAQRIYHHRLVDFEQLGEAIWQSLGKAPGWFGADLQRRRASEAVQAVEADTALAAVAEFVKKHTATAQAGQPPAARVWADKKAPGYTAWVGADGLPRVEVLMATLLREVQGASLANLAGLTSRRDDPTPTNERQLRHFMQHREPTLRDAGVQVEFTTANNRSAVKFTVK